MGRRGQTTRYPIRIGVKMSEAMRGQVDFIAAMRGRKRAATLRYLIAAGIHHELKEGTGNGTSES